MREMRVKRVLSLVALIAVWPLLTGAGGFNPPPFETKIAGPSFNASVVMDPHEPGNTSTGKRASIRIYHVNNTASAMFDVPATGFALARGCDLTLTEARFRYVTLVSWIPEPVLNQLFEQLGSPRSPGFEPVITRLSQEECTPDPANPTTTDGGTDLPGILSFQAVIRFQVPK